MEFTYGGFIKAYRRPFTSSSSNYTKFSDQAPEERLWSGGGRPESRPESLRELEKMKIREEIIAEEVERRRILEAEVRRELVMERETMAMQNRLEFASSFMLGPPHSRHSRFQPGVLHGETGGMEMAPFERRPQSLGIREITTSRPKVDEKGVIGLETPYAPTMSGAKRKPPSQAGGGKKHKAKVSAMRENQAGKTEKSGGIKELKSVEMDLSEDKMTKGESSKKKLRLWCKMC